MKPRIVSADVGPLYSNWLSELMNNYFELVSHSTDLQPGDIYYTQHWDDTAQQWAQQHGRVIVDCLMESHLAGSVTQPGFVLYNANWFWYNESLWYRYLGYHTYEPQCTWRYRALVPMRLQKPHRDALYKTLAPWLDEMIWSYQALGYNLPQDQDPEDWNSQRYFNPYWYDNTTFSIVSESLITRPLPGQKHFVTEKTFKPMAFWHPFVIFGQPGTLEYLREQGFETFGNLFDESYDREPNWYRRCDMIVRTATAQYFDHRDTLTQQKLQHNHARFFDQALVTQRIVEEIIEPLLNYAET